MRAKKIGSLHGEPFAKQSAKDTICFLSATSGITSKEKILGDRTNVNIGNQNRKPI